MQGQGAGLDTDSTLTAAQRRQAYKAIYLSQCAGNIGVLVFQNGFLLAFLTALSASPTLIMSVLSFHSVFNGILSIPGSFWSDRAGIKRVAGYGNLGSVIGYGLVLLGLLVPTAAPGAAGPQLWLTVAGLAIFSASKALAGSSWFALLVPIIPAASRGRFFGLFRFTWMGIMIVFTAICTAFLNTETQLWVFYCIIACIFFGQIIHYWYYRAIPELKPAADATTIEKPRLWTGISMVLRQGDLRRYMTYIFVLYLWTAGVPMIYGLIETTHLQLGDRWVVILGTTGLLGSLGGFLIGGRVVDRMGMKPVFIITHVMYGILMLSFVGRGYSPLGLLPTLILLHTAFGFISAAASIAVTAELFALLPVQHRALANGVVFTMFHAGRAASPLLAALLIDLGVFPSQWHLAGLLITDYDAVLISFSLLITVSMIALVWVPSVQAGKRLKTTEVPAKL